MIFPNEILDMIYYKSDYTTRNNMRCVSKYLRTSKKYNRLFRLDSYNSQVKKWNKKFFYLQELMDREAFLDEKYYMLYEYDNMWKYVTSFLE
jgi:hypothetical protein